jgi:predicted phage-related endonuclease
MKIHDLIQGSPEWKAYRAQHFNASDAPAMMGCSIYKTRAELLREMHTGLAAPVDAATQRIYDAGHRLEALARPLAEEFIGAELYPVTGSSGKLSASFDGLTLDESIGFEHKHMNKDLRAALRQDDGSANELLPLMYRVQMEQQLLVSGAQRILFMASQWDADGNLQEERHCWYTPDLELRAQIVAGWEQFEKDLATYALPHASEAAPIGKAPETLPALRVEVTGKVTASNLAEFKQTALAAIRSVNRDLQTDQDFADAEKAVKWCADVEERIKATKEHALSQTADIDALFKALDDIAEEAREVRLDVDKLVKRRKVEVKEAEIVLAREALARHLEAVNAEIAPATLSHVVAFGDAIKGLKTLDSVRSKLDTVLAAAKIEIDAKARDIRKNQLAFKEIAADFAFLFADIGSLLHRPTSDFGALVQGRIDAHKVAEAEKKRLAAEAQAEAQRKAQEAEAERQRLAAAASQAAPVVAPPAPTVAVPAVAAPAPSAPVRIVPPTVSAPRADEPATLKLGSVCERLGFTMTAVFVSETLGIKPARIEGASRLYRESDFQRICAALQMHISNLTEAIAA